MEYGFQGQGQSGPLPPLQPASARTLAVEAGARAAILVEGWSDQAAVDTLARRQSLDLQAERIITIPIGGITNLGAFVHELGHPGLRLDLAGLCDAAEENYTRRTLGRAGLGPMQSRTDLESRGFFVCEVDLEDELIRALGTPAVEAVLHEQGELTSFRRFQDQPAQRGRSVHAQLHRFLGTRAKRKIRYGSLLVEAIDLSAVPRPLELVIAHSRTTRASGEA